MSRVSQSRAHSRTRGACWPLLEEGLERGKGDAHAHGNCPILLEAAINHSKTAIATHEANHKGCQHFQQDITEIDPADVPESDLLLTSPECTNHSDSKGQKHYHQFDLFGDIVFDPLDEKSRNTMEDVVRFAKAKLSAGKPYKCIVVENVIEVVKWRKYALWLASLIALGYQYQALYWNTQFFGVPQSRDRVYLVFWLRDLPAPDLDFRPRAFCEYCEREIQAVQAWKTSLKWGSYREQYVYRCPCCAREVTPFFTPVASVLNLDEPGDPLFQRTSGRILKRRPLMGFAKGLSASRGSHFCMPIIKNHSIAV